MIRENEQRIERIEDDPIIIFFMILIAAILLVIFALSVVWINEQMTLSEEMMTDIPAVIHMPAMSPALLPTSMPAANFLSYLPVVDSSSESDHIWQVTNIKISGYELDGQRYDLATFTHSNSPDTATGYCINRGWDIPAIGTEYLLTAEGIFVPLLQSATDPLQRFLKIQ